MRDAPNARRRDAGQAAIEFALALPLLAIAVLGAAQVVDLAADRLAAAAQASGSAASDAALAATGTRPLTVEVSERTSMVTVTVTHINPTAVPVIGALIGDVELTASATMPIEPP